MDHKVEGSRSRNQTDVTHDANDRTGITRSRYSEFDYLRTTSRLQKQEHLRQQEYAEEREANVLSQQKERHRKLLKVMEGIPSDITRLQTIVESERSKVSELSTQQRKDEERILRSEIHGITYQLSSVAMLQNETYITYMRQIEWSNQYVSIQRNMEQRIKDLTGEFPERPW
jgi:hypothetical protein